MAGGERLKQVPMDGMLVAGKMLFPEEWVKVGMEIGKTLGYSLQKQVEQ